MRANEIMFIGTLNLLVLVFYLMSSKITKHSQSQSPAAIKESPVVQASYKLCQQVLTLVGKFPVKYKFILGDKLSRSSLEVLALIAAASSSLDLSSKKEGFIKVQSQFLPLRLLLRMSRDLNAVSAGHYVDMSMHLDEIQKQVKLLVTWVEGQMGTSGGESRCFDYKQGQEISVDQGSL